MKPQKLQENFFELCRRYAHRVEPLGTGEEKGKKVCAFSLILRNIKLQLVYRPRGAAGVPPSTLYARVYPDKNCPIYLHLPQLLPLLEVEDYRACYFPYIETARRMEACFWTLVDLLEELRPMLEELASSGGDGELLERFVYEKVLSDDAPKEILKAGSPEQRGFLRLQQIQDTAYVTRFTQWKPWNAYLMGETQKAVAAYKKQKELLPYERSLLAFLETPEGADFLPMPRECFAYGDMQAVSCGRDDAGTLLKEALALYPLCAALGCLLMGVMQLVSSWGTLCWFGAPWYMGFLVGGIPAMFGAFAFRRQLMPLVSRKTFRQQLEFDDIVNDTPGVNRFAMGAFLLFTAGTLVISLLMAGDTVRLYRDHGDWSTGFFQRESFRYEQIQAVYHIDARYNDYGERIQRDSYVIALENGQLIDLDGYTSPERTEKEALPLFREHGIQVIRVDSDRDLPGEL